GMIYGRDIQNETHQFSPYRKLLFSLDLNSTYLSSKKGWLKAVAFPFTIVKFPAPAIEFSVQGIRFHWLHF
ncbi:MAG: hypothetical protein ORN54_10610, partial [Cyclobacteriaceae bacterium]|nr:hypothetical protein [Cyclobacteriaceae bacterium]